jgi:hypothetical protein
LDQSTDGTYFVAGQVEGRHLNVVDGTWIFPDKPLGAEGETAEFNVSLILADRSCAAELKAEQPPAGDGTLDEDLPPGCKRTDKVHVNVTP